jgi:inner membrane protein
MAIDPHWAWLTAGLLLAAAEVLAPGLFLIWIAGAALLTGLACWLLPMPVWAQFLLFGELAAVAVLTVRSRLRDWRARGPETTLLKDRATQLVGASVVVTQAIVHGEGRVHVGDSEWLARGEDAPVGTRLRVARLEGTALVVETVD